MPGMTRHAERQARFAAEYLIDRNARAAALRAGYSRSVAERGGHRLLRRPAIAAAIEAAERQAEERLHVAAERVLAETARIAFADPGRLFGADGRLIDLAALDASDAAMLREVWTGGRKACRLRKVRLVNRLAALRLLARRLGLPDDADAEDGAPDPGPDPAPAVASLSARQHRFIAEYLIDLDAGAAARRAGYRARNARHTGYRLLKKPAIAALLDARQSGLLARFEITCERVIDGIAAIAFFDWRRVCADDDTLRHVRDLEPPERKALTGFDVEKETGRIRYLQLADKVAALVLLADCLPLERQGER